jgi:Flp pilus assembly protein TadG
MRISSARRSGATTVECAIVFPVTFLLIVGLVVGAAGMFRYQEMSHLARQGARYASVHGTQWQKDTGLPAATPQDIYDNAIAPGAMGLDQTRLSYTVTWDRSNAQYHTDIVNGNIVATANTVTVKVTYQWIPEAYLGGITLSSTSVATMQE